MRPVVLYTDPMWALAGERLVPELAQLEREVFGGDLELRLGLFERGAFSVAGPRFAAMLADVDALVIYRAQITEELVAALRPRCRVVARQGVGTDNLRPDLLAQAGIFAFNVPDYCVDEVSTHTLALILAHERGVCLHDALIKGGGWDIFAGSRPRRTRELSLGIVGFGRIGRATARKAQAFFHSLHAYDPAVSADLMAGYGACAAPSLQELLARSDVVVLHASLNESSRNLIGPGVLPWFRPGAVLVNTARGALVDSATVLAGLKEGRLGGYLSDVFTPESPHAAALNAELVRRPDVIATSHRAFLSSQAELSQRRRVAQQIAHVLRTGEPPTDGRLA